MEKGYLRCDANISVRPEGQTELGTKVEIKNLNSFKMVQRALEYEERRQRAVLANGAAVRQETRLWNEQKGESAVMRTKESADDYRYFPDPDLPPLEIDVALVEEVRGSMPELPAARRARFAAEYSLPEYDIGVLLSDHHTADYFEAVAQGCADSKAASNWVMGEVLRTLNERGGTIADFRLDASRLATLIGAQAAGRISRNAAKQVFEHLIESDQSVDDAIAELGLEQVSDAGELRAVIETVLAEHPQAVADYRAGKAKALHALQGQTMKATRGRANPRLVQELLRELLS